jgi:hypothetical protein
MIICEILRSSVVTGHLARRRPAEATTQFFLRMHARRLNAGDGRIRSKTPGSRISELNAEGEPKLVLAPHGLAFELSRPEEEALCGVDGSFFESKSDT